MNDILTGALGFWHHLSHSQGVRTSHFGGGFHISSMGRLVVSFPYQSNYWAADSFGASKSRFGNPFGEL